MELEDFVGKYDIVTDPTSPISLDGTLEFDITDNGGLRATITNEGHAPKVVDDLDVDDNEIDGVFRYHGMKIKFHAELNGDQIKGDADAGIMDIEFKASRKDDDD